MRATYGTQCPAVRPPHPHRFCTRNTCELCFSVSARSVALLRPRDLHFFHPGVLLRLARALAGLRTGAPADAAPPAPKPSKPKKRGRKPLDSFDVIHAADVLSSEDDFDGYETYAYTAPGGAAAAEEEDDDGADGCVTPAVSDGGALTASKGGSASESEEAVVDGADEDDDDDDDDFEDDFVG